jgi:lysophospholipase L1-like esterase
VGSSPPFWRRHPRITAVVTALVALEIADLGAGALYRLVTGDGFYYAVVDPERALNRRYRTASPLYHHDLAPNVDMVASWGADYPITTNSLGFRDRTIREVPLRTEGPRWLFLGDSFTEGVGVAYADTFVGRIEEAVRPRGIEVLNAGVSSYSPAIYWRKARYHLEERGLEVSDVIVFLDISDAADEAEQYTLDASGNVASRKREATGLREFFRQNSILYAVPRFLKLRRERAEAATKAANPLNASIDNPRAQWTVDDDAFRRYGERGLAGMRANMDRLAELAQKHGASLTVVVYPWPTQIARKDLDSRQVRIWRDWARERGARFVDLFPAFVSHDDARNEQTIRELFIPDDFHWNPAGHRRVAELFLSQTASSAAAQTAAVRGEVGAGSRDAQ